MPGASPQGAATQSTSAARRASGLRSLDSRGFEHEAPSTVGYLPAEAAASLARSASISFFNRAISFLST